MRVTLVRTGNILKVGLRAILRNKMRSALTMLGIIIGVACVIAMIAVTSCRRSGWNSAWIARIGPTNSRSNRYFRLISRFARSTSLAGRSSACAGIGFAFDFPRPEHGAIVTYGFRRIRLTFPDFESVMTSSRPPPAANHTGVETPEPSRR